MKTSSRIICAAFAGLFAATLPSCKKEQGCTDISAVNYNPDAEKDDGSCTYSNDTTPAYLVPTEYSFTNVNYTGQTVRILLLRDLSSKIGTATTTTVTAAELSAIYDNSNALYASIATNKKLSDKVSDQATKDSIQVWFSQIESLSASSNTYVRADGVDLKQMVEKTLMGSVLYYRAVNDYLNAISSKDNATVTPGTGTVMEHAWDEAFGYFGAARDFNSYTDAMIMSPGTKDSNGDGVIDDKSEKCFYYATTAAKRDDNTKGMSEASKTDFTKHLFDAFLKGRAAITNKDYTARDNASITVKRNWDRVIAATVLHYINEVKADLASSSPDLNKHWSELKGYAGMIKHNPENLLGTTGIANLESYIGNNPTEITSSKLASAASQIVAAYSFTTEQTNGM